ncbi:MAG: putative RDD family membrane protein YckC [Glaciecola sp.]|jgi:uncharacterized RDD family membrane protein YckC
MEIEEKKFAGFWIRVGATFIDLLALIILIGLNMLNLYLWKNLASMLILNIAVIAYKPFMEFKYGATFGKMALKIKVLTIENQLMTIQQSLTRSIPWLISGAVTIYTATALMTHPLYLETEGYIQITQIQQEVTPMTIQTLSTLFFMVSVIVVAFDKQKRGIHDMLAKTYCLKND